KLGARLSGISVVRAGSAAFTLSVFLAAVADVLITPITKMAYDFGFLIGLKGIVGAIIGGLSNPAVAGVGALGVGVAEQFSAFYVSSAYKDVLVFLLLIPVLLVRSRRHVHFEEHVEWAAPPPSAPPPAAARPAPAPRSAAGSGAACSRRSSSWSRGCRSWRARSACA